MSGIGSNDWLECPPGGMPPPGGMGAPHSEGAWSGSNLLSVTLDKDSAWTVTGASSMSHPVIEDGASGGNIGSPDPAGVNSYSQEKTTAKGKPMMPIHSNTRLAINEFGWYPLVRAIPTLEHLFSDSLRGDCPAHSRHISVSISSRE